MTFYISMRGIKKKSLFPVFERLVAIMLYARIKYDIRLSFTSWTLHFEYSTFRIYTRQRRQIRLVRNVTVTFLLYHGIVITKKYSFWFCWSIYDAYLEIITIFRTISPFQTNSNVSWTFYYILYYYKIDCEKRN